MKQTTFLTTAIACVMMLATSSCSDTPVLPTELPASVQAFVTQHFPSQTITYADKDWEWFGYKYDVVLADGTQISFDTDDQWDKVSSMVNPVPAALVPAPIATHVNANFPSVAIIKIDKERYGYDIELANQLELKYNHQGALMEMDD